jgi:DNA-binding CsgD family transcriptional regulator
MLSHNPPASVDLSAGYARAADLAERRRQFVLEAGDVTEAAVWAKLSQYCHEMAATKAVDDDQYQFQRDRQRQRDSNGEPVLGFEDAVAQRLLDSMARASRQLSSWAQALIEVSLMQLSPMQRVCLELVVGGLVEVDDVAAALNITPSQVRQHVSRARIKLQAVRSRIQHLIPGPAVYSPDVWYVKKPTGS